MNKQDLSIKFKQLARKREKKGDCIERHTCGDADETRRQNRPRSHRHRGKHKASQARKHRPYSGELFVPWRPMATRGICVHVYRGGGFI